MTSLSHKEDLTCIAVKLLLGINMDALKLGLFIQSLPKRSSAELIGFAVLDFLAKEAVDPLGPVTAAEEQRLRIQRDWLEWAQTNPYSFNSTAMRGFVTPRSWAAMARVFSRENTESSMPIVPTFGSPGMGKSATINRMYHQLSEQEQSCLKEAHKLGLVEFLDPFDGTWYPKLTAHFALGTAYRIKWPQVWEVRYWSLTQRQKDILRFAAKCGLCVQHRTNDSTWHAMNTDDGGIWQNSLIYRIHPQDLTT